MSTTTDIMNQLDMPRTVEGLMNLTGKSETTVRKALKALEAEGAVVRGANDKGVAIFSLPTNEEDQPNVAKTSTAPPAPPAAEDTSETSTGRKPGQRDPEVAQRDQDAIEFLRQHPDGVTRNELATALQTTEPKAYTVLWRLAKLGSVKQVGRDGRQPKWGVA